MKRLLLAALLPLTLIGCDVRYPEIEQQRSVERERLFVLCMELAAKMPRQSDDDVARIVDSCNDSAYYQTNAMMFDRIKL